MTSADTPLVHIDIETDRCTAALWAKARTLDPQPMAWAAHVGTAPIEGDAVRVTVALAQWEYEYHAAGVGAGHVTSLVETLLDTYADSVITAHENEIKFNALPAPSDMTAFGPYTLVVRWSLAATLELADEIANSTGLLAKVGIVRLTAPCDEQAWIAVTMPREIYDRTNKLLADPTEPNDLAMCLSYALGRVWLKENPSSQLDSDTRRVAPYIDDHIPF